MASYHITCKTIGRSAGRSATAAAAYRSAERIRDMRTGEEHDYTRKRGVVHRALLNAAEVNQQLAQTTLAQLQKHNNRLVPAVVEGFKESVYDTLKDGLRNVRCEADSAISGL